MGGRGASDAFRAHVRALCLGQFPCGAGSWNKSCFLQQKELTGWLGQQQQRASAAARDRLLPPTEETAETLTEFLRTPGSPWAPWPDCSPEDQQLRELAVQCPQVIRPSFIFSYFKSLRIVNKGVTQIDANLLKFPNLEELILSANQISKIVSTNLPPTLKVLELCGNEVDSLKDLCASPPPELQHLGLGHNCRLGSSQDDYLSGAFWPNLISLDLSYNNFTDLRSLLSKLRTLKKLRVLVLQGNPLALMPGYRGFTIDCLPKLCALDDNNINPDERHSFLGLAGNAELLQQQAVEITVTIGKVRGIPSPTVSEDVESSPEGACTPVITYNYYVTYEFARGEKTDGTDNTEATVSQNALGSPLSGSQAGVDNNVKALAVTSKLESPSGTSVYSTLRKPWAETIEFEYRKQHITRDLVSLKAYLLAGTTVAVVEEKIVSWPVIVTPVETPSKKGKGKEEKGKLKDSGKGGNKKKKKSPPPELRSDPPILKTLGSGHVNLESFLEKESLIATVCDFGVLITELGPQSSVVKEKDGKKGKNKEKKTKGGTESTATQKTPTSARGKGRKQESPKGADVQMTQPVPLTVEFQIQHLKWKSASQILIKREVSA